MRKITKAVFPVAGLGTRFLPATKASPKEMLTVVDKPLIQYAVEEAAAAGITDMVFITGRNKRSIEDHFDRAYELETELELRNKTELLKAVQEATPHGINCIFIRQAATLGLGHAVLCATPVIGDEPFAVILADDLIAARVPVMQQMVEIARRENGSVIGDEPFAVILADDLIDARVPVMQQMVEIARRENGSVIGVMEVAADDVGSWGIVETGPAQGPTAPILRIVEKPEPGSTPSTQGVVGRYVLTPRIFHHLRTMPPGSGGEIQLTDGIARLLHEEKVVAYRFEGRRYDCGRKLGYLEATVDFGLKHPELADDFASFLRERASSYGK
jgi:UTP--glucose-1-phosphate uridylyltransferase